MPHSPHDTLTWGIDGLHVNGRKVARSDVTPSDDLRRIVWGIMMAVGPTQFREMANATLREIAALANVPPDAVDTVLDRWTP